MFNSRLEFNIPGWNHVPGGDICIRNLYAIRLLPDDPAERFEMVFEYAVLITLNKF